MYWHNFSLSRYIFRFIQQFFLILWYPWSIHVLISLVLKFLLLRDILVKNWQLDWKVLVKIQIIFLLLKYVINLQENFIVHVLIIFQSYLHSYSTMKVVINIWWNSPEHSTGTDSYIKRREEILGVMKTPHN